MPPVMAAHRRRITPNNASLNMPPLIFARAEFAVDKYHGHLLDFEPEFVSCKLHFDLEGISLKAYGVQVDSFEHFTTIANKSGCGVVQGHPCNSAHIL